MYSNNPNRQGGNYPNNRGGGQYQSRNQGQQQVQESAEDKRKKELVEKWQPFPDKFKVEWITNKIDRDGIEYTEALGFLLAPDGKHAREPLSAPLTASQIRIFFGEARRIQMGGIENTDNQTAFMLLRPKLAYAAARMSKDSQNDKRLTGVTLFKEVMDKAWYAVDITQKNHYQNFVNFAEAIVAFHKANGGKDQ